MTTTHRATLALTLVAAAALGACQRTVVENPQPTDYPPEDVTAQLDFWHELPGRSAVSNNEGFHGIILLFDGADTTGSYEGRVAHLKEKGWLQGGFDEEGNLAMQRGTLARLLCKAMGVKGGVMMQLTRAHPRYAYRELVFLGVMPDGSDMMVVDGLDYLGVVSRAQDYMVVQGMKQHARDIRQAAEIEERQREQEEAGEAPEPPERIDSPQ